MGSLTMVTSSTPTECDMFDLVKVYIAEMSGSEHSAKPFSVYVFADAISIDDFDDLYFVSENSIELMSSSDFHGVEIDTDGQVAFETYNGHGCSSDYVYRSSIDVYVKYENALKALAKYAYTVLVDPKQSHRHAKAVDVFKVYGKQIKEVCEPDVVKAYNKKVKMYQKDKRDEMTRQKQIENCKKLQQEKALYLKLKEKFERK